MINSVLNATQTGGGSGFTNNDNPNTTINNNLQSYLTINSPAHRNHNLNLNNPFKKRLSVSPIISTHSFYNKLNVNSPNLQNTTFSSKCVKTTTTTVTTSFGATVTTKTTTTPGSASVTTNLPAPTSATATISSLPMTTSATTGPLPAHHHFFQRNFSPMATLSRSPTCSSSPAVLSRRTLNTVESTTSSTTVTAPQRYEFKLGTPKDGKQPSTQSDGGFCITPSIEINNESQFSIINPFKTPKHHYTPNNKNYNNHSRRSFTPKILNNTTMFTVTNQAITEVPNEAAYEESTPEYCMDHLWMESSPINTNSATTATTGGVDFIYDRASKFFSIVDLYMQKYVCYLVPIKQQLRCLKVETPNPETGLTNLIGGLQYIPARDAVFVEKRNLMVIIDNLGSLAVYSGLTRLCKLQLHNIQWSQHSFTSENPQQQNNTPVNKNFKKISTISCFKSKNEVSLFQSNVTPIKTSIASNIDKLPSVNLLNDSPSVETPDPKQLLFKTPKQGGGSNAFLLSALSTSSRVSLSTKPLPKMETNNITTPIGLLQQQNEFKSVNDATGSRFSVKLNNNKIVRVNLNEPSTCKLVNMCLEALKYGLNEETYYELIQQWFIHRYTIGSNDSTSSIRDQLNLFIYLILNICGCFDMSKLEKELPVLSSVNNNNSSNKRDKTTTTTVKEKLNNLEMNNKDEDEEEDDDYIPMKMAFTGSNNPISSVDPTNAKRSKSSSEGTDNDWEFMLKDEFVQKFKDNEKNLNEFVDCWSKSEDEVAAVQHTIPTQTQADYINKKTQTNCGILYPCLKQILYIFHLIYEECKLYRSMQVYCESLVQIQYLISIELSLPLYTSYYEYEYPFLLKLQLKKKFPSTSVNNGWTSSTSGDNFISSQKNSTSYLSYILTQDPPVLHKFLLKLMEKSNFNQIFFFIFNFMYSFIVFAFLRFVLNFKRRFK
jgi:hypothetical protein